MGFHGHSSVFSPDYTSAKHPSHFMAPLRRIHPVELESPVGRKRVDPGLPCGQVEAPCLTQQADLDPGLVGLPGPLCRGPVAAGHGGRVGPAPDRQRFSLLTCNDQNQGRGSVSRV